MTSNQLNNISVVRTINKFTNEYYLDIAIDGQVLDSILNEEYPEDNMLGLVPTLLHWLENENERKVTWDKIIPQNNETVISPILMCSDDLDFWCTIIVAESKCIGDKIIWQRLGSDDSDRGFYPETVGQKVNWFDKIGPFIFDKQQFIDCVNQFRQEFNKTNA